MMGVTGAARATPASPARATTIQPAPLLTNRHHRRRPISPAAWAHVTPANAALYRDSHHQSPAAAACAASMFGNDPSITGGRGANAHLAHQHGRDRRRAIVSGVGGQWANALGVTGWTDGWTDGSFTRPARLTKCDIPLTACSVVDGRDRGLAWKAPGGHHHPPHQPSAIRPPRPPGAYRRHSATNDDKDRAVSHRHRGPSDPTVTPGPWRTLLIRGNFGLGPSGGRVRPTAVRGQPVGDGRRARCNVPQPTRWGELIALRHS